MTSIPVNQRIRIHILQAAAIVTGCAVLFAHPLMGGQVHESIEMVGVLLVLACIAGRMWSILYIGSRKNAELVTAGPYSMTRNPLYFFSTIGAAGIGLMTGSLVVALALGLIAYLVLHATARKEALHLHNLFGEPYSAYASRTPVFWPNPMLYFEPEQASFSPDAVKRTFLDGLMFLLAFPLLEFVEYLHDAGYLPILFHLP
jgi:protein-S-isoprenylcysteine O-methyltransferase Ste14